MYPLEFPSCKQTVPWSHVTKLNILLSTYNILPDQEGCLFRAMCPFGDNLKPIVRMVQSGILPDLQVLSIVCLWLVSSNAEMAEENYQLAKANVSVYLSFYEREWELED